MAVVGTPTQGLDRIDWDFPSTGTSPGSIHSLHWFPGNFIPQIPSALVQLLSEPGDLVCDPFCGSGTTGVEAMKLGRRSIQSDRVTACTMISRAKIDLLTTGLQRQVHENLSGALTWEHLCQTDAVGSNGEGSNPNLARWYAPGTLSQLRYIWKLLEQQPQAAQRRILTMIFSDVLFACASPGNPSTSTGKRRRHHWGWVADNVQPRALVERSPVSAFVARLNQLSKVTPDGAAKSALVLQQDVRHLAIPSGVVDLIVTSPPYIGVIDYTRAMRLLYMWMDWPFDSDRGAEIGARFKRWRSAVRDDYLAEMRDSWRELSRVMRSGSYCAVVIGESRRYTGTVDQTMNDLRSLMPCVWGPIRRNPTRRRVSERGAREFVEYLYVFQKP